MGLLKLLQICLMVFVAAISSVYFCASVQASDKPVTAKGATAAQVERLMKLTADKSVDDHDHLQGVGHAVLIVAGQDSKLEANSISYDKSTGIIDARGNVKILRNGELTEGSSFRFRITSNEYLITDFTEHSIPFISGINFRTSAVAVLDNEALVTSNSDLAKLYGTAVTKKRLLPTGVRAEEPLAGLTMKLFTVRNDRYGIKSHIFGGDAVDTSFTDKYRDLAKIGPQFDFRLNLLHSADFRQTAVRDSSPFYFDQYLEGGRSLNVTGDGRVPGWIKIGSGYGYGRDGRVSYFKSLKRAYGPDDFKLRVNHDLFNKVNRFGFKTLRDQPSAFEHGDFPKRAIGMRNGKPVAESPCIQYQEKSEHPPLAETSWTY